jgi:uncharacterized membrane protein
MSSDLVKELEDLKARIAALTARVWEVEQRLRIAAPQQPRERAASKGAEPVTVSRERCALHPTQTIQWWCVQCNAPLCGECGGVAFHGQVRCKRCDSLAPVPQAQAVSDSGETLETKIGRYWLNRIGIASLVLGIAFFILYSFQYLGAAAKIGIGLAVGAGLVGLGVWLERKASLGAFARGLIGGGWAVIYFTTYAMHHIPAVRVVPNALADLVLLAIVAAGAVAHALKYRSQVITALAFSLGFITTSISDVTYFTLASSVLLVLGLVTVAARQRWHGLLLYGIAGSYLTHIFWVQSQIAMSPIIAVHTANVTISQFWLHASFLALYWIAYTVGILSLDEADSSRRNALLTATLVNGLMGITQLISRFPAAYEGSRYLALLGVGAAYTLLSPVATARKLPTLAPAHLLLGLTLMTLAIPERLSDRWTSALWIIEVASLTWLGLRYNRWTYRVFAFGLGVVVFFRWVMMDAWSITPVEVLGWSIPWRMFIGPIAVGSFAASATSYRMASDRAAQRPIEELAFPLYTAAASLVAWKLTWLEGEPSFVSLLWALEAAALVLLGWRFKERILRLYGAVWFGSVTLRELLTIILQRSWWELPVTIGVIGVLYGASALYRLALSRDSFGIEEGLHHGYAWAASLLLTLTLWRDVAHQWLSLACAAEGLALIAIGFLLKDRPFRTSGLLVFALMVLRVLFVDLAGAETVYRILSFIVVGAILLAASFAYARFTTKRTQP